MMAKFTPSLFGPIVPPVAARDGHSGLLLQTSIFDVDSRQNPEPAQILLTIRLLPK
jgi:hypothetical protein